ncbi:galactose-1-phosphate uridylyltransferase (plasmid) [Streptomyces sp. NBC_00868]|uniref:galactose-1-phosphate uridylyltransferase n=1 Tax=Streptomyces sp. NBC_00868 TaxID=2903683 RepID=UPI002F9167AE|nr:galactose-1-phosphate uridylyltransferase [Streptomyces sp. NBC_00868]
MTLPPHHKTSATLADGREIHFYDDQAGRRREVVDTRALPPVESGSELRWDPTVEEWVVMAAHRKARPADAAAHCPLCPSTPGAATEIPAHDYDVAVFENRYPALRSTDGGPGDPGAALAMPAGGRCEVMAFGSEHETSLARMTEQRVRTVIEAWADRTRELNALPEVEQVVCFENRGSEIGATLAHPHGQIYAYPFVPSRFERMQRAARHAHARGTGCVFCSVLKTELAAGHRIVARSRHWTSFVPHAARWPYEVHLYANRHVPDLAALTEEERADLTGSYRSLLRRFETVAEAPLPYMALWIQAPARGERELGHLHAQVFSDRATPLKPKRLAAGELGAGTFISEVEPERAAAALRAAETWPAAPEFAGELVGVAAR